MSNTIIPGDYVVVKKRAFGDINRGDIIVFRYNDDETNYIARVVALPGEMVQLRGTRVLINRTELKERRVKVEATFDYEASPEFESEGEGDYTVYYSRDLKDGPTDTSDDTPYATNEAFTVPSNMYFVVGDNRDNSADSRYRGPIARERIFGKATMIYWSESADPFSGDPIRWNRIFKRIH